MKAIVVSEATFLVVRDHLIAELKSGIEAREARVKSGDMTGMNATPEALIHHRVHVAFEQLRDS